MVKRIGHILLIALACTSCMREPDWSFPNTPEGNLRALWTIIDEKYCYVEEKGLSWEGVLEEYLPRVDTLKASQYRELFDVMAAMLDTLKDGHVNIYSSFDVSVPTGWYDSYPSNYNSSLIGHYVSDYKIAGGLNYSLIEGHEQIGYIRYSSFSNAFSPANMYYVLQYFKNCKGIIVDVRNNGGGNLENAYKLASTFMDSTTLVGYWQHKTGTGHNDFSELEPIYVEKEDMTYKWNKKVMVLCNRQCYSATNTFCSAMRYAPKAMLVGGITGGGGGMPLSYELPNGWMVRFSSVRMTDRDKVSIEPGVAPDIEVTLSSKDKDDLIEKAIEIIDNQ